MTEQEVFDKVKKHLLKQNSKAMDGDNCVYRSPNGSQCAIGCMIPDDQYDETMELNNAAILIEEWPDLPFANINPNFLKDLQEIHDYDDNDVVDWPILLQEFATDRCLTY